MPVAGGWLLTGLARSSLAPPTAPRLLLHRQRLYLRVLGRRLEDL